MFIFYFMRRTFQLRLITLYKMYNMKISKKIHETDIFFEADHKIYTMQENFNFFHETEISVEADQRPIKQAGCLLPAILPVWIFLKCCKNYFQYVGEIIVLALILARKAFFLFVMPKDDI